jgi:hypothetical protein
MPTIPGGQADGLQPHGCDLCEACCTFIVLQVNPAYQKDKAWVELHGIKLVEKGGALWAYVPTPCLALKNGRCSVYENRPKACRDWPSSQADIDDLNRHLGREVCRFPIYTTGGIGNV